MTEAIALAVPLLNPNEPEVMITDLPVSAGESVAAGEVVATVETTKSTADLTAEQDGYVVGLRAEVGQSLPAGEVLLWIAQSPEWQPPAEPEPSESATPAGVRLTDPARAVAEQLGISVEELPAGPLITEEWLRDWRASQGELPPIDEEAVVVYGGGGHGKAVIELLQAQGAWRIAGVIDDGLRPGTTVLGVEVLGGGDRLSALRREGVGQAVNAVGGIGDITSRVRVFERLRAADFRCPTVVHPTAFVEESAQLAAGAQIFPQAYVGSSARIGFGAIVNTAAVVSHDCRLGDYANVAPGSLLAGGVTVGEGTLIGMGVTVNLEVSVGERARIGNSAVVKRDVPAQSVVAAGSVWPPTEDREV